MKRKHSNINYFPTNASEIENVIWHSKKHFSVFTYFLFSFCHIEKYIKLCPYDPSYQHQKSAADSTNNYRSSRLQVFCKKRVLKNFAKFIGKHLCRSLFFNEVAGLSLATLLKKRHWHRCFPVNFVKYLEHFFIEHLRWLFPLKSLFNFIEIALQHWCSPVNLLHIFRTLFS